MGLAQRAFRTLFGKHRTEQILDEELRDHFERELERNLAAGMTPEEARRTAERDFGPMALVREECRDARGLPWLEDAMADMRHAWRLMRKNPGFAAAGVLSIALGVAAATSIFSIVNGVLLRPLPYADPETLVAIHEVVPEMAHLYPVLPASAYHIAQWKKRSGSFASISAMEARSFTLTGAGEAERLDGVRVSANFFDTLGVLPRIGRGFTRGEDTSGRENVAIITDALWRRRFDAARSVLGRTILLDNVRYQIIGVLPPEFRHPGVGIIDAARPDVVQPVIFVPKVFDDDELSERMGRFNYGVVARLKRGVGAATATAGLNVIAAQLLRETGEKMGLQAAVMPLLESRVGSARRSLLMLLAASGLVLAIICVNLANLALARGERRASEYALRMALGARRGRLIRQVLVEALLIAFLGGALGVAGAAAGLETLVSLAPKDLPRIEDVSVDPRVLLFALAITTATGLLFGLAPAWKSTRSQPQAALQSDGRSRTGGRSSLRLRNGLVAAEVSLGAVLLITASLVTMSFVRLMRSDKGFRAPGVLTADISIPIAKYSKATQRNDFHRRLLDRLGEAPGVAAAGVSTALPLQGETWIDMLSLPGSTQSRFARPQVNVRFIDPDYLRTMGIPLLSGRTFSDGDRGRNVMIISERLAETLFPNTSTVGRRVVRSNTEYEVIGVARDVRANADRPSPAMSYRPYWEWAPRRVMLVVRAHGDPWSVAGAVREAVRSIDADVPVTRLCTMREVLDESVAQRRFQMLLVGIFALVALGLASIGIYGVVSYAVARRTGEIGIRMALGASRADVYGIVLRQGMKPVIAGLAAGLVGALIAGRAIESLLYEVNARDPMVIAVVTAILALVSAIACFLPARRAARVDPSLALRAE